ncbi:MULTISPECIES: hypothetical protein [unclassified Microbacterium]|uniref:hypothetical protein n=1 Tax=unclassified Microbacterium TaxID=2609290 RepID=UPI00214B3A62|nr:MULTISPECIES: hypothetical protein [unclassified Microbacterium]MCR2810244.1 hypothetical protein [Microbacterium sp. zg.B185]WIM19927.1 hypothetical protein QNO12_03720 [Microbacterium sp. zg-B185]
MEFSWTDPAKMNDLPEYAGFVQKTALAMHSSAYGWGLSGFPYGTNVAPGRVMVRTPSDLPEPNYAYRMLEMPAGTERWRVDLPVDVQGGSTFISARPDLAEHEVVFFWRSDADRTEITVRSLDSGRVLSTAEFAASTEFAWELGEREGSFVAQRDLIVYSEGGVVTAVRPQDLGAPVWQVPGEKAVTAGEVVFVDGVARAFESGASLGWSVAPVHLEDGGAWQAGGILFATGDDSSLTPIDPRTGQACGPTQHGMLMSVRDGYVVVTIDRELLAFDRSATFVESLGSLTADSVAMVLAGRPAERTADGRYNVFGAGGTVTTLSVGETVPIGYDSERLFTQSPYTGPVTAYDLATGAVVWQSEPVVPAINWGGTMVRLQTNPMEWPITVAE